MESLQEQFNKELERMARKTMDGKAIHSDEIEKLQAWQELLKAKEDVTRERDAKPVK
ncbi:MAG: hypothetical protein RLZZ602_1338 [Pseudomonadota bacterium]|jgi:hypothetical protein